MRILRFLITSLFSLGVAVALTGLLGREALLTAGSSMVRSALTSLQSASANSLQYAQQCRGRGGSGQSLVGIEQVRLRFLDDRQFVTEVVCQQFSSEPIIIKTYTLPPLVKKVPGASGIVWGVERSGIELEIYGRRRIVAVENEAIKTYTSGSVTLGVSPQSTCSGHGYMCCQQETLSGVGQPFTDVTDCPRACYSQCLPRPLVLSLNSDPYPDREKNVIVQNGQPVDFNFIVSYEQKDPVTITLDFGDGEQETFTRLLGKTSHTYSCAGGCMLTAKLTAKTAQGVESAVTPVTHLNIIVQ